MFRSVLLTCITALALASLPGCRNDKQAVSASRPDPQILVSNRADKRQKQSTPWVKGAQVKFPEFSADIGPYWVIFVDQTPCAPVANSTNPLAYKGEPGKPPTCLIDTDPPADNRDRHFRYALWPSSLGPVPPFEQVYARATCPPVCR